MIELEKAGVLAQRFLRIYPMPRIKHVFIILIIGTINLILNMKDKNNLKSYLGD